jgi:glycosyltransferase involved in cell wall biosynthesis
MRITFVSPTGMSGGVRVVAIYAQQLKQMGHTVRVISPIRARLRFGQKLKLWLKGNGWLDDLTPPKSHFDGSDIDHRVLDRVGPVIDDDVPDGDVVIATLWLTAEWVAGLSECKGAKVYLIQHHEIVDYLAERCHATYRLPLHKIVIAQWLKRVMKEQYGDSNVDLVPNSVDRTQFFAPVRGKQLRPSIGFLYSKSPSKGLDTTLAALRIVRKQFPELRMISFGSERTSPSLELPEGVEFFYSPPQDEIRKLYARCDVWITASLSEGFNLPALEAMACRTPVVATRTGWPEEAVKSGWNGILVDVGDVRGVAEGVKWLLSRSDEDWRNLSANAFATSATGSWRQSAMLFEQALRHACLRSARGEIAGRCTSTLLDRGALSSNIRNGSSIASVSPDISTGFAALPKSSGQSK